MSARIDATSLDVEKLSGYFSVVRKPRYFYAKIAGPFVEIYPAESQLTRRDDAVIGQSPRKIRKSVFLANFTPSFCDIGEDGIYYKTTTPCYAIKMDSDFFLSDIMDENEKSAGLTGDYLITRTSGINEIISKEEFFNEFVLLDEKNTIIN